MKNKEYIRRVIRYFVLIGLVALILLFNIIPVMGSSYTVYFPVGITDTTGAARTNIPVLLGFASGGQGFVNGGFITSSGTNTNCQIGTSSIPFTMGTTQVGVVLSTLGAYSTQQVDFYTGYSPAQTSFPMVFGANSSFATSANTAFDIGSSGNYTFSGFFNPSSTGYLLNNPNSCTIKGNGSGNASFSIYGSSGTSGTTYPVVATTTNGSSATSANVLTTNLPSGYIAGDLLIIHVKSVYSGNYTITSPAGWTELWNVQVLPSSNRHRDVTCYKVAAGTEGSSVSFQTSSNVSSWAYSSLRIQTGTYSGVPVAGVVATGSASAPNPPALTSGFGAVDTLWLACGGTTDNGTTYSTGFTLLSYNGTGSGDTGSWSFVSYKNEVSASNNPDAWGTSCAGWAVDTIAIRGYGVIASVNSPVISAASHVIQCYISGGNIGIKIDSDAATTTAFAGSIPASTSSMTWISANIFCCANYITVYKGAAQSVLYQPTTMISGTSLPDSVGGQTGTITWGTNSGITLSYGEPVSYSPTSSNTSLQGGTFVPPTMTIGTQWYGTGNMSGGTFWSIFTSMGQAGGLGTDGKTILMFVAIGIAMILGMIVFRSSGSVLISTIFIIGILYFFSSMSVIPFAMVFIILIISAGIMYLVRLI